jgi:hypothetical protein
LLVLYVFVGGFLVINKIIDKIKHNKNIVTDVCFGFLLLFNLVAIPIIMRDIISMSSGNWKKYVNPLSAFWYEQSKEAKIFFDEQSINLITACCIMASLLYFKHTRLSFLCLILPLLYVAGQSYIGR